jgi:AcrR family transcriptional regulator
VSPRARQSADEISEQARQLVDATFRVIATTGDAEPPVRPILREAGLSRQAFYRCFGSKDELMVAVLEEGRRLLADYLGARMRNARTPEAKVRVWIEGVMRQAEVQRSAARTRPFMAMSGKRAILYPAEYRETERVLSELLEDAIAAGTAQDSWESRDPARDALVVHDYVLGSLRRHLMQGVSPSRAEKQALVSFALRALGARVSLPA